MVGAMFAAGVRLQVSKGSSSESWYWITVGDISKDSCSDTSGRLHGSVCMDTSPSSVCCRLRSSGIPIAGIVPNTQLLFPVPISTWRNQVSLRRWLILRLRQGICKVSLEHLVVPESQEVLKKHGTGEKENIGVQPESSLSGQKWNSLNKKIKNIVLDYNPQYKINTHEFIQ